MISYSIIFHHNMLFKDLVAYLKTFFLLLVILKLKCLIYQTLGIYITLFSLGYAIKNVYICFKTLGDSFFYSTLLLQRHR